MVCCDFKILVPNTYFWITTFIFSHSIFLSKCPFSQCLWNCFPLMHSSFHSYISYYVHQVYTPFSSESFDIEDPEWFTGALLPPLQAKTTSEMCPLHLPSVYGHPGWSRRLQQAQVPRDTANTGMKGVLAFVAWHSLFGDLLSLSNLVSPANSPEVTFDQFLCCYVPSTTIKPRQIILFYIFLLLKIS